MKKLSLIIVVLLVVAAGNVLAYDNQATVSGTSEYDEDCNYFYGGDFCQVFVEIFISNSASQDTHALAGIMNLETEEILRVTQEGPGSPYNTTTWYADTMMYLVSYYIDPGDSTFAYASAAVNWIG